MGVDARLFINSSWRVDDVKDLLKTLPEVIGDVNIIPTHSADYTIISFKWNEEQRELGFLYSSTYAGFTGNLLSFRTWGSSKEILTVIAKRVGGFFSPEDTNDDNWERFDNPGQSNLGYMVRYAITSGQCDGNTLEQFVKFHNQKTAEWDERQHKSHEALLGKNK